LYELLDTCKACGGRKGMFGLRCKKYEPTKGGLEIFYAEAVRISLRRTFSQVKQPIHAHLSMVRLDSNGSPVRKAQGNIIAPAAPAVAATHVKLMIGTVTAPIKKKCVAIPETKSPDIATLFFQVVAIKLRVAGRS